MRINTRFHRLNELNDKGVTLVELLIVMGLLAIFMVVLASIFTATLDIEGQTQSYSAVVSEGRFLTARLDHDIASASAVTTPAPLGSSDSSLVLTIGSDTDTYAISGDRLQLTDGSGSANLTGNDIMVSNLSFQTLGASGGKPTVRYSFTLTSSARSTSGPQSQTFSSTAGLR